MRRTLLSLAAAAFVAGALSACGQSAQTASVDTNAHTVASSASAHHTKRHKRHHTTAQHHTTAKHHHTAAKHLAHTRAIAGALVVSGASPTVVQSQAAPGFCHARGSGLDSQPDPACTPGALNPAVTQATIHQTICVRGDTETIRPSESVTEAEKSASMAAYGDRGSVSAYEYDHLVSLELGGALNDARNLWPEPGASPNPKDTVENALHRAVCDGQMPLAQAQHIIATGWVSWANSHHSSTAPSAPASRTPTPSPSTSGSGPDKPVSEVNCSDFPTHAAAQNWFDTHGGSPANDVAGLDGNGDGIACQSLP
jgi:hypothetical protein